MFSQIYLSSTKLFLIGWIVDEGSVVDKAGATISQTRRSLREAKLWGGKMNERDHEITQVNRLSMSLPLNMNLCLWPALHTR